ncbi:MAG: ATP-binding protein [Candidatus Thermoplasmatota archaeon]|nr:ATP-binding protein [Candidatus Thermoplasmatota archaeon]
MLGRIIGKNVSEIVFRYPYREDIKIGEILVAEDEENDSLFFMRVVDLQYGQEGSEKWSFRTAGEMMMLDEMEHPYSMREKERRLFKIGVCSSLGYVRGGAFRKPKAIPSHFSKVRRANKDDYKFLKKNAGDIEVGKLRSGEKEVDVKVCLKGELIPHHIGIFATTGMGKSNLMRVFAASAMTHGKYGLLIVDPHGEYYEGGDNTEGLRDHPMAKNALIVYSPHRISGPHNTLKISAYEITVGDLQNIFSFTEAQRDALYSLRSRFGKEWLVKLYEMDTEELVIAFGKKIQDITFGVLKRRAEMILQSEIIHRDESVAITDSMLCQLNEGKVVLVDTSGLYEYEELLVGVILARKILARNKNAYRDREQFRKLPPILITMEEAQRVLKAEGVFAQIAREGRKFKVGLCAITQQPKLIKEELLSQFNTFFILGLADEGDRNIIKGSAKQDISKIEKEIQTLEAGEVLITYPGAPFAIPAKIHWYDDYIKGFEETKREEMKVDEDFY